MLLPLFISINCPSFVTEWDVLQKIYSKMLPVSCTDTYHDVTDLVNHGMVRNTKKWISWERNIFFLRNKQILNLYFRWLKKDRYQIVLPGFELTVCETRYAIHFDNFAEHFFLIFVKFANQSLVVKLSFIFKQR